MLHDTTRFTLAVMYDANEEEPPSTPKTLQNLIELGSRRRCIVTLGNFERLQELNFDALLIRQMTSPKNKTYELATMAARHGIPVIDDPDSILTCCNKLEQMTRFAAASIPIPLSKTLKVTDLNWEEVNKIMRQVDDLKYPVVIKDPTECFCRGVFKVDHSKDLYDLLKVFCLKNTGGILLQAQEFVPTRFDWRVGVLNGRVLYCCQYNMAPGHWQVIQHKADGSYVDGTYITLKPKLWPQDICSLAIKAAQCVGKGLYGVDIKETKNGPLVIEVNDNPSIDFGEEDKYGNVWESIIEHFRNRIEKGERRHEVLNTGRVEAI